MPAIAPSIAFPFPARFRLFLHLLVLVAVCTYADTIEDITPVVLTLASSVVSWLLTDSPAATARKKAATLPSAGTPAPDPLGGLLNWAPRLIPNAIVLVAAFRLAIDVYNQLEVGTQGLIMALSGFLAVLAACKLYERKSVRNIGQIIALCLLLVVASTMFSNSSLFFFLLLSGFFVLLCYLALLLNIYIQTAPSDQTMQPAAVMQVPRPAAGQSQRIALAAVSRDLRNVARHCLFLAGVVSFVLFLTLPRSRGNPFLFSSWGTGVMVTGYSEVVQFQDYTTLSQSDAEVMRVQLTRDGQDVSSEFTDLYFRGNVLYEYDDLRRQWIHGRSPRESAKARGLIPADAEGPFKPNQYFGISDSAVLVNYTVVSPFGRTLFVLDPTVGMNEEQCLYNADDHTWRLIANPRTSSPISYGGYWNRGMAPLTDDFMDAYRMKPGELRAPEHGAVMVRPELAEKARQILKTSMGADAPAPDQPIPVDKMHAVINVFESYLRMNYRYSLTTRVSDPALDPTTDFILNRGINGDNTGGHCEYFASAMVMLCRSVGLYARMVQGYHGGELNTVTQNFVVRQKYAHAWAEVYIPEEGWVLSDPSPIGSNLDTAGASGHLFKDLAQMIQSIWSSMFVNFDNDSRAAIAGWFSNKFGALLDMADYPTWTTAGLWGGVILLSIVLFKLRQRFRRLRPLLEAAKGKPHRQLRLSTHVTFLEELLHLFERGQWRRPDQTPLEFLEPHMPRLGPAATDVRWLIQTAYAVRFGGTVLSPALRQRVATALRNVKHAMKDGK